MRVVQIEPGPMPTFTAVHSCAHQIAGAIECGYVPGDQFHLRQLCFHLLDRFEHQRGVPMRAVDGEHVDFGLRQFLRALQKIAGRADRRAYAQAALDRPWRRRDISVSSEYP